MIRIVVFAVAAATAIASIAIFLAYAVWNRATRRLIEELRADDRPRPTLCATESLPEPVARYFRAVADGDLPHVQYMRLRQTGVFKLGEDESSWTPFHATQHITLHAPGFVWDARFQLPPIRVRDAYVSGHGTMLVRLPGVATLVDEHDKDELDRGALLRYLAEAAWFPMALLPSGRLRWSAVDDRAARATLIDGEVEVSATFRFDNDGDIVGVSAERFREVEGNYVLTPWRGRFWNHASHNGLRIPTSGEVAWILPEGELVYWRATVSDIEMY